MLRKIGSGVWLVCRWVTSISLTVLFVSFIIFAFVKDLSGCIFAPEWGLPGPTCENAAGGVCID